MSFAAANTAANARLEAGYGRRQSRRRPNHDDLLLTYCHNGIVARSQRQLGLGHSATSRSSKALVELIL